MSQYGQDNDKQGSSLMDGVPVKISENYKPPRKITLPVGYQNRTPIASADEVYDFSLENTVLKKIAEWRKLQEELASRRRESIQKHKAEKKDKSSKGETDWNVPAPVSTSVSVTANSADVTTSHCRQQHQQQQQQQRQQQAQQQQQHHNNHHHQQQPQQQQQQQQQYSSILTPVPISIPHNTVTHNKTNSHHFNLSDFEADTSDPFDTVELKTINDMEELAHVLQPTVPVTSTVPNCYTLPYNSSQHFGMVMESNKDSVLPHLNGLTGYRMTREGGFTTLPVQQKSSAYVNSPYIWGDNYVEATTNQRSSQQDGAGSGALSKSVPDIMKELDRELKEKRRGPTPPTLMSSRLASLGSTGLENWKPWPDLDSPEQTAALKTSSKQKCSCALPNPFTELSIEEQNLAMHISEMGFPLPRVARACQLVGSDDKKIVEFLLLVQALEERGYPGDRAERALTVNECDLKEAERCLEATTQLLDLGFSEERVAEALAKCNNDRDQALEHLIT